MNNKNKKYSIENAIEPDFLWALYWGNEYSAANISLLFDCTPNNINRLMRKYNIPRRSCKETNHSRKVEIPKEKLESLYISENMTLKEVGELYDCCACIISRLLTSHGIKIKERKSYRSWNKGTKGIMKPNKSFFKKGHIPWNKGLTKYSDRNPLRVERRTIAYKDWQKKIYKRDKRTCQICHRKFKEMDAHHIKTFKDYPEDRYKTKNGICLCKECHRYVHNIDILSQQ